MRKILGMAIVMVFVAAIAAGSAWAQTQPPKAPSYDPALLQPATLTATAPATFDVKFTTTKGDFVVRVTRAWAPRGADRFYNLVKRGYYDEASFFRVISGFMVQFGISAHPQVSRVWNAAPIKDDPVKQHNTRGMVTYAKSTLPNSRTTQVFINFGDNSRLDSDGFAPFGKVVEGMNVVDSLYSGYGEGAPDGHGPPQGQVQALGKAYLDKSFPKLDSIKTAAIVTPEAKPAGAPAAPSAAPETKPN